MLLLLLVVVLVLGLFLGAFRFLIELVIRLSGELSLLIESPIEERHTVLGHLGQVQLGYGILEGPILE